MSTVPASSLPVAEYLLQLGGMGRAARAVDRLTAALLDDAGATPAGAAAVRADQVAVDAALEAAEARVADYYRGPAWRRAGIALVAGVLLYTLVLSVLMLRR